MQFPSAQAPTKGRHRHDVRYRGLPGTVLSTEYPVREEIVGYFLYYELLGILTSYVDLVLSRISVSDLVSRTTGSISTHSHRY